jgi:hypothetical protein
VKGNHVRQSTGIETGPVPDTNLWSEGASCAYFHFVIQLGVPIRAAGGFTLFAFKFQLLGSFIENLMGHGTGKPSCTLKM